MFKQNKKSMLYNKSEDIIIRYSGACKSGAYFNEYKLPKLNGILIESIWCPCDFTKDKNVVNAKGWSFKAPNIHTKTETINRHGFLPEEFKKLMGEQIINGKKEFVRHISFRTDSSGHASEDTLMSIYVENNQYNVWDRNKNHVFEYKYALTQHDPYVKKWLKLFNTSLEINHPSRYNWEFEKLYPSINPYTQGTRIQYIEGIVFPDKVSKHWKPFGSQPFYKLNERQIIVYHEENNELWYLDKVLNPEVGDWGLVSLSSCRDEPYYMIFRRWNKTLDIVRYCIDKIQDKKVFVTAKEEEKPYEIDSNTLYSVFMVRKIKY